MARIYLSSQTSDAHSEWIDIRDGLRLTTYAFTDGSQVSEGEKDSPDTNRYRVLLKANDVNILETPINAPSEEELIQKAKKLAFELKRKLAERVDEAEAMLVINGQNSVVLVPDARNLSFTIHSVAD